jgi:hypothetical protein
MLRARRSSENDRIPFGPPLGWDPITSTLIYGEYEAVLIDPLTTVPEVTRYLTRSGRQNASSNSGVDTALAPAR